MSERWETIQGGGGPNGCESSSHKLKVPGGTIYRTIVITGAFRDGAGVHVAQTFVPDPPK